MRIMMVTRIRKRLHVLLSLGLIVRSERDIKNRVVFRVYLCVLFVHGSTTVHEWGSVELYTYSDTGLGRKRKI
jgi:hypothetical protein